MTDQYQTPQEKAATAAKTEVRDENSEHTNPPPHEPTQNLYGWITHTEFTSLDPDATKDWCRKVLGWNFMPNFPTPAGDYHLFAYSEQGGGGIKHADQTGTPGSVPFVHVADAQAAFDKAIQEGAQKVHAPERIMERVTIAMVRAPGGVLLGFSGP